MSVMKWKKKDKVEKTKARNVDTKLKRIKRGNLRAILGVASLPLYLRGRAFLC